MSYLLGTLRGLQTCSTQTGKMFILAMDHRQNLRRELRPESPDTVSTDDLAAFKSDVTRELAGLATAVLLDPEIGAPRGITDHAIPGTVGLIVAIEATGYAGSATERSSRVLDGWSVEKVKRIGASALKLLVYYHPSARNALAQDQLVASIHQACRDVDLPLFIEPVTYSPLTGHGLVGDDRRRAVIETARHLSGLGGDVLKVEFPCGPEELDEDVWVEACHELDDASAIPWIVLSGGISDDMFSSQVRVACDAGASGVAVGRSVWSSAASVPPDRRREHLRTEAAERMALLDAVVENHARPWFSRPNRLSDQLSPGPDWFRAY